MTTRPHINEERSLDAPLEMFDLARIATETWAEVAGMTGHNAITLRKTANIRIVLLTMHAGSLMHDHDTFAPITLHCISGHVRLIATQTEVVVELRPQMLVAVNGGIQHRVEAVEDSVCLLTMGGSALSTAVQP